jgi:hypothetical protein
METRIQFKNEDEIRAWVKNEWEAGTKLRDMQIKCGRSLKFINKRVNDLKNNKEIIPRQFGSKNNRSQIYHDKFNIGKQKQQNANMESPLFTVRVRKDISEKLRAIAYYKSPHEIQVAVEEAFQDYINKNNLVLSSACKDYDVKKAKKISRSSNAISENQAGL